MTATDEPNPFLEQLDRIRLLAEQNLSRPSQQSLLPDDDDDPAVTARTAKTNRWHRIIPERFNWADLADFDGDTATILTAWAAKPDGRNLVLFGPVGAGKSHAAVAACRLQFFDRAVELRFFPVVELLDMLRPGGPHDAVENLWSIEMLILDDLGTERSTDWTSERLYMVINRRYLERRPTIVTTNLPLPELEKQIGPAVYSRLVGDGAVVVGLGGKDRRRNPQ